MSASKKKTPSNKKSTRVQKPLVVDEPETTHPSDDGVPEDGLKALQQFAPDVVKSIEEDDWTFTGDVASWTEIANIPELKKYTSERFKKQLAGLRKHCFPDRLLFFKQWAVSIRSDNLDFMLMIVGLPEGKAADLSPSDLKVRSLIRKRTAQHLLREQTEFLDEIGDAFRKQKVGARFRQLKKRDVNEIQRIAENFRRLQSYGSNEWSAEWDRSKAGWSLKHRSHDKKRYFKEHASDAAGLVLKASRTDDREKWQLWLDLLMGTEAFVWPGERYKRGEISHVCEVSARYLEDLVSLTNQSSTGSVGRKKSKRLKSSKLPGRERCQIYRSADKARLIDSQTGKLKIPTNDSFDTLFSEILAERPIPSACSWVPPETRVVTIGDAWESKQSKIGETTVGRRMQVWATKLISDCAPHRDTILDKPAKK